MLIKMNFTTGFTETKKLKTPHTLNHKETLDL